jgi:hypothetical protein
MPNARRGFARWMFTVMITAPVVDASWQLSPSFSRTPTPIALYFAAFTMGKRDRCSNSKIDAVLRI